LVLIPVGLLRAAIAEDALRGPAAESEDERVEAVTVAGGVLALADGAHEAHEASVAHLVAMGPGSASSNFDRSAELDVMDTTGFGAWFNRSEIT
jgi:hypothetical protein